MRLLGKAESSDRSASKEIAVVNRLGIHARPAAMFVKTCNRFHSEIWVEKDGEQVSGKSIMGLMMLAAGQGSKLLVTCEGADADQALEAVEQLIGSGFDEE